MSEPEYRQDDETGHGQCPLCRRRIALDVALYGVCEEHGRVPASFNLPPREDDDPLTGRCARCEKWWDEHPGGFCPDQVVHGQVEIGKAAEFIPADEALR